ncbi:MAG TPA: hypothetical protein EYH40_05005 [Desulfurococcales archaeon]|nr:hypothetical protein [Desulfurococcales archaeon]
MEVVVDESIWNLRKVEFLKRIKRDLEIGYFDREILNLIMLINSFDFAYTTSSCSGRIVVYEGSAPWFTGDIRILYKTHSGIEFNTLKQVMSKACNVWLSLQPPIIHINFKRLDLAVKILNDVRNIGFKHSGIISISPRGIVVQLRSTEHLDLPLKINGKPVYTDDLLSKIVSMVNSILVRSKLKLKLLEEYFREFKRALERNI